MNVYTDESGDLGWTLDKPYRQGGSSKFLTIAHLIVPKAKKHIPKRVIRDLYSHMSWPTSQELKASNLKPKHRMWLAGQAAKMLANNQDISVVAMTAQKENVLARIRRDPNKLYNYMIKLGLLDHIKHFSLVTLVNDERTVKVESGNSMFDYLQTILCTELESDTVLEYRPIDSKHSLNVQFADFMANFVWRCYELGDKTHMSLLRSKINHKSLYFSK